MAIGWRRRWSRATVTSPDPSPQPFRLLLLFYQRDAAYSLGLASLSAYAKRAFADLHVHLVPIFREDGCERITDIVAALQPDLIGASAMSPTWLPLVPYLHAIKARLPRTPVLVGGYQAIVSPEETLADPAVDYVCVGDGEEPLVALIRQLRSGAGDATVAGLWTKRPDGPPLRTAPALMTDVAELPFPDYSIFERDGDLRYLSPRAVQSPDLLALPVISGRGCPYRCTYCANTTLLDLYKAEGRYLRKYDPEPLVEELARLRDRYHADYFQFWDEEFLYERRYARELLRLYRRRVRVPFSMFVRVENMTEDLCATSADAGCHAMWFGVESGSETYRRVYLNRKMPTRQIVVAAETARRYGIHLFAFAMVGLPFETESDARATLALIEAIDAELTVFSQFLPLPGTPLYEVCRQHDLLLDPSVERQMWPLGTLNIKEHPGAMSRAEMRAVGADIMTYLVEHERRLAAPAIAV